MATSKSKKIAAEAPAEEPEVEEPEAVVEPEPVVEEVVVDDGPRIVPFDPKNVDVT